MPITKTPDQRPVPPSSSSDPAPVGRRKRLAKAFDRPLDKTLGEPDRVRVKVSLRDADWSALVDLQRRLAAQGVRVKKKALLCAGLRLLATDDDTDFLRALAAVATGADSATPAAPDGD